MAVYAKEHKLAHITRDFDFSDVRNHPPAEYPWIILLQLRNDAITATVVKVLEFEVDRALRSKDPAFPALVMALQPHA